MSITVKFSNPIIHPRAMIAETREYPQQKRLIVTLNFEKITVNVHGKEIEFDDPLKLYILSSEGKITLIQKRGGKQVSVLARVRDNDIWSSEVSFVTEPLSDADLFQINQILKGDDVEIAISTTTYGLLSEDSYIRIVDEFLHNDKLWSERNIGDTLNWLANWASTMEGKLISFEYDRVEWFKDLLDKNASYRNLAKWKLSNIIRDASNLLKDKHVQGITKARLMSITETLISIETRGPVRIEFEDKVKGKSIFLSTKDWEAIFESLQTRSLILEIPVYDESHIDELIERAEHYHQGLKDFLILYKELILPALKKYATTKDERDFRNILSGVKQFVSGCSEIKNKNRSQCREFIETKYRNILKNQYMSRLEGEGAEDEASKEADAMKKLITQVFETAESLTSGLVSHSETKKKLKVYIPKITEEDVDFLLYLILITTNTVIKKMKNVL